MYWQPTHCQCFLHWLAWSGDPLEPRLFASLCRNSWIFCQLHFFIWQKKSFVIFMVLFRVAFIVNNNKKKVETGKNACNHSMLTIKKGFKAKAWHFRNVCGIMSYITIDIESYIISVLVAFRTILLISLSSSFLFHVSYD